MNKQINTGEIVIYQTEDGQASLEVNLVEETVWLDAHQMAKLFQRDRTVIVRHVRNIYQTGELLRNSTCAKIVQVAQNGKKRVMDFYNLDMIISVGYRVNSLRGTQFRIWANKVLKDYPVSLVTRLMKRDYNLRLKNMGRWNSRLSLSIISLIANCFPRLNLKVS